jgi:hypothetical protein
MDQHNPPALPAPTIPITLLGQREPRIPTAGKIRAGIKVLTKKAASNPQAKALYDEGVRSNASFEEIERKIVEAFPGIDKPLVPKNVAWFTVRPNDFPNPVLADQILGLYGEDRGDGVRRLYRFPVMFPADRWQAVMPHELACWSRSEKRYWSEYGPDGHTRYCKMHAPARIDAQTRRVLRTFGGRAHQLRPENEGRCDPELCPEFQNRLCNLNGRFIFYIPGIKSLDAFELQTNSFYALSRAIERFETIAFLRGGRLAGFLDRHHTPFYLTKNLREVSHIDLKTGLPVRSAHWIIELEAPVDVSALLIEHDRDDTIELAEEAVRTLHGQVGQKTNQATQAVADYQAASDDAIVFDTPGDRSSMPASEELPERPVVDTAPVYALVAEYRIPVERFDTYAVRSWGAGWRRNVGGCARVLAELEKYRGARDALIERIAAELGQ